MEAMFRSFIESRVTIEYAYYKYTDNVALFEWRWGGSEALAIVSMEAWFLIGKMFVVCNIFCIFFVFKN